MASHATANTGEDRSIDQNLWKNYKYPDMKKAMQTTQQGSKAMLDRVDSVVPFSSATSILDIACGPGSLYHQLFDSGVHLSPSASLLGVDIAQPMIDKLHERQKEDREGDDSTWKRVHAWVEDATHLSAADASQSHVLSQMGIFLIPNYSPALTEAHRVLTANGVFSMSAVAWASWNEEILAIIEQLHPDRRLPRVAAVWKDRDLFRAELEKHGFSNVDVSAVPFRMSYESAEQIVETLWATMPFIKSLAQGLSDDQIRACKDAMVRKIKTDYPDQFLPAKIHLAIARK